jgi:sialic acid synthase SpsE
VKTIKVGKKEIGDGLPAFVIAEVAWSHDGSKEKAKKIIDAAADANADAICFHITSMEDYMIPLYGSGKGRVSAGKDTLPVYKYLSNINLDDKAWAELFPHARKRGLLVITMCNDHPSLALASKLGVDGYVISPASLCEVEMVKGVAGKGKPVFLRIGGALMEEVERAITWIRGEGNEYIVLIHGFQSYPTKLEDINMRLIPTLKKKFSVQVGFADHTDGGEELALVVPLVALPFDATVIEKHITHDRSLRGEDFESALDPKDFKRFVHNLREMEKAFGSPEIRPLSPEELNYRQVARKRTVANVDIRRGEKITRKMIAFKRSDEGVFPDEGLHIMGKVAIKDIKKNEPITKDKVS